MHPETNMSNIIAKPDGTMVDEAIGPKIIVGGTDPSASGHADRPSVTGRPVIWFEAVGN